MANTTIQPPLTQRIPAWVKIVVMLCVVLMSAGAIIAFVKPAMLVDPHAEISPAVRTYAGYLTARNLTLAVMLLILLAAGARRALGNLVAVVGFIQLFDFVVDCMEARWTVAPGVLVLGILLLLAAGGFPERRFGSERRGRRGQLGIPGLCDRQKRIPP